MSTVQNNRGMMIPLCLKKYHNYVIPLRKSQELVHNWTDNTAVQRKITVRL